MASLSLLFVLFSASCLCCCVKHYTVPEPIIELRHPKGFSVKIPHDDGITVFAFHGKINEEMESLEAGTFSEDICTKIDNFWTFEDRTTKLKVGDKIYYWLFVIRNGLGYRYDDGEFTVKEDTPYVEDQPKATTKRTTVESSTQMNIEDVTKNVKSTTIPSNVESFTDVDIENVTTKRPNGVSSNPDTNMLMEICERTILNITDSLLKLQTEVSSLRDTNEILREISEKHPASARTLKIDGRLPVNEDALSTVKGIIKQKLALSIEIAEARRNKDGSITFEAASLDDKVQIIKTAKEKLRYSRIYLTY